MAAPWNSFRCADGWVIICAGNHPTWVRLCETIGRPDLLADPRYATQGERVHHVDELEVEITAWTQTRTVAEVESILNAATVAAGSVLSLHDVLQHAQFDVRGLVARGTDGRQSGGVFNLDREPLDVRTAAWRRGSGTRRIVVERCGARPVDYRRWLANGIIFEADEEADVAAA
jgi:formyl-CoA transferase